MLIFIAATLVLLLSGFFVMFGIGGASIFIPVFMQLGIDAYNARIAGLFVIVVSTAISTYTFIKSKLLKKSDFQEIIIILLGMLLSIPIGVFLSQYLSERLIYGLFSIALFISAFFMLNPPLKKKRGLLVDESAGLVGGLGTGAMRGSVGGGAGLANGTLGIGGGVFIVPVLIITGVRPRRAAALSIACVLVGSLFSLSNHFFIGLKNVNVLLLALVGIGALIGSSFGSRYLASGKLKGETIKKVFPILLIAFSIKLAIDFITYSV